MNTALLLLGFVGATPPAAPAPAAPRAPPVSALSIMARADGPTASFTDVDGAHLVTFTLRDAPRAKGADDDTRGRTLSVVHEVLKPGDKQMHEVWHAKDFVLDCPFDVHLELVDGSLELTDLDRDGRGEFSFAYELSCKSDVSPDDLKLLFYEGTTKYALRGTRATYVGAVDATGKPVAVGGGAPTVDPAFSSAPPAFLPWAKAQWERLAAPAPRE